MLYIDVHLKNTDSITITDEETSSDEVVEMANVLKTSFKNRVYGRPRFQKGLAVIDADEVTHYIIYEA